MMEAILLVGGLGTRLRPLTDHVPKPMLPVAGIPLVVHQIIRAREAGVTHIVLATSYRAEVFGDTLGDGSGLGVRVDYAVEDEPLGTGGAIRHAASRFDGDRPDDPVLIFNGDIVDGHDIKAQVAAHLEADADATLYLTRVDDPRMYGCVPTDAAGRVTAFLEKAPEPVSDQVNAGCYVFRRSVLETIPTGQVVSVERETFPGLLKAGRMVLGYVDDAYWRDLGTPASYVQGCADVVRGLVDAPAVTAEPGERLVLEGAQVASSARLSGGTCVGRECSVGSTASIDGSVLLDRAVVGAGAALTATAVGRGARIGDGSVLDGAVVGDGVRVPPNSRAEPGACLV